MGGLSTNPPESSNAERRQRCEGLRWLLLRYVLPTQREWGMGRGGEEEREGRGRRRKERGGELKMRKEEKYEIIIIRVEP